MRLFPKKETLQAFMTKGLPLIFAVAWIPVVWMLLVTVFGPVLERLFGTWQPVVGVLVVSTVLVTTALTIAFRRYGLKIFEEKGA